MAFKYKTAEDFGKMTADQQETYLEQKRDHEAAEIKAMVTKAVDEALPSRSKELKAANPTKTDEEIKSMVTAEETVRVTKEAKFDELVETVNQIKENQTGGVGIKDTLPAQLKANKDKLKAIAKGDGNEEVVVKTLLQRSAIANNDYAYDLPDIGQLATRKLSLYDLFPKLTIGNGTHNGVVRYYDWDKDTIARAAAAVAEGAVFPASTAKWVRGTVSIQKIGDTLPVTEEFFEDEQMFAAEVGMFLQTNVALEIDRQLADGDGTSNQIVGLKASIDAYTPVAAGITDASIYDLIVKLSEAITTTGGAKYNPDFTVMNIADINRMKLKKDANNNYVIPPFVSRDGAQVSGITVIESNIITANTMVIGDRRFARIYEMGGVVLSKGMINDQFTTDEMTLKARKRMCFLIRGADKGGFLKVTNITTALSTLAS